MMRNRLYTKDEVLQVVEAALNALDSTEAPIQEPEHLDNDIPQKSSPVNAKVTLTVPEAAELIGICKPTMYEMVRDGTCRQGAICQSREKDTDLTAVFDGLAEGRRFL